MKALEAAARCIAGAVTNRPGSGGASEKTEVRADGSVWLVIEGPSLAPGEPGAVFYLPDNGRDDYSIQPED